MMMLMMMLRDAGYRGKGLSGIGTSAVLENVRKNDDVGMLLLLIPGRRGRTLRLLGSVLMRQLTGGDRLSLRRY